jgi:hypothetical protein
MKLRSTVLLAVLGMTLASCASMTPGQRRLVNVALDVTASVLNIAIDVAVNAAVSKYDLSNKANYIDSAALGLRTITDGKGRYLVSETIEGFTSDKRHWVDLAEQVEAEVIKSGLPKDVAIEAAAKGLNQAAASIRQK